jgi:hypothetical protein
VDALANEGVAPVSVEGEGTGVGGEEGGDQQQQQREWDSSYQQQQRQPPPPLKQRSEGGSMAPLRSQPSLPGGGGTKQQAKSAVWALWEEQE